MPRGGHNKIGRDVLIADITGLARSLGDTPTQSEYREHGRHSPDSAKRAFGSWNGALKACGLTVNHRNNTRVTVECEQCGAEVEKKPSRVEQNEYNYCSQACLSEHKKERYSGDGNPRSTLVDVECSACGETIQRPKWQRERNENNFCDYECWGEWAEKNLSGEDNPQWVEFPTQECAYCGRSYKVKPSEREKTSYCSVKCQNSGMDHSGKKSPTWNGGPVTEICECCGDEYQVKRSEADGSRFCSYDCMHAEAHPSGENHPQWNADSERIYYGHNWMEQRERSVIRDHAKCQIDGCETTERENIGMHGIGLDVHHKTPLKRFREGGNIDYGKANALENLITLCRNCHRKVESDSHSLSV